MMRKKLQSVFACTKSRCYHTGDYHFKRYGGLGATICPEWLKDGKSGSFIKWALANGYQSGYHLVRLDKALPYGPDNCKLVSAKESKSQLYVEYKGEQVTLVSLVERFYPSYSEQMLRTIRARVTFGGWDAESAVTVPMTPSRKPRPEVVRIKTPRTRCDRQEDGFRKDNLYSWYGSLWNRITNPKAPLYKYYGAHGITLSPDWSKAGHFVEWALANGYQPGLGLQLVRINKRLPYGPDNCRLVSREDKWRANADAQYVEYKGNWFILLELVERVYPDHGRLLLRQIKARIYMLGWDVEMAVDTPIHPAGLHIKPTNKNAIEWLL